MSSKNPGKSMMIFVPYIVCDKTGIHGYPEKKHGYNPHTTG